MFLCIILLVISKPFLYSHMRPVLSKHMSLKPILARINNFKGQYQQKMISFISKFELGRDSHICCLYFKAEDYVPSYSPAFLVLLGFKSNINYLLTKMQFPLRTNR